jgi:hypothetical protein
MALPVINIGSKLDGKGFKQAETASQKLGRTVKRLGVTFAATFSAQKIAQFGKAAVKAFIEDEKAASQLAISVKNLGLAFETPAIEKFISGLAQVSGVTDDQLRPAMQKLLQTTGSVTKSQELLAQALDISRGSGVDYETVVNDLSLAFTGQTRGLRKYYLGLTQAELKTMSFEDVQKKLTKQFTGANAVYLETYAGKIGLLSNAAGEAEEAIGKGLVDALALVSGGGNSIQPLADSMQEFGTWLGDAIYGLGIMIAQIKSLPGGSLLGGIEGQGFLKTYSPLIRALDQFSKMGAAATPLEGRASEHTGRIGYVDPNAAARKKAELDAAKRAKLLADMKKKELLTTKKQNDLIKASKTLDLDRIGITAALKGKISETDALSLNLQLALLDKNEGAALKLSAQLEAAVKRNNELDAALRNTAEAPNPYRNWKPPGFVGPIIPKDMTESPGSNGSTEKKPVIDFVIPDWVKEIAGFSTKAAGDYLGLGAIGAGATADTIINVKVDLDGTEVGNAVRNASLSDSLSGSFNTISRAYRFPTG